MATGSGKTKVMALAIAWQYFNAAAEGRGDCAASLIIAPNVIVFERLRTDFAGGRIFKTDPVIPLRADNGRKETDEPPEIAALLSPKPSAQMNAVEDFNKRIVPRGGPLRVLDDEADHTHDEDSAWNNVIRRLHTLPLPWGEGPG